MFKFKIFSSFIEEEDALKGEYGYFLLKLGNESYGEYREDIDLEILSMDIYDWFTNFINAIKLLRTKEHVYISDVETPEVWIKLANLGLDNIEISELRAEKPDGSHAVESEIELVEKKILWTETIKLEEFTSNLNTQVDIYLSELKLLNSSNNKYVKKLDKLVSEI
ncbi:hypothetical protein [Carnobacterium maltaromaticum]|uniref:hypothetical protein n=1 Tax=Carnobacterium maltaromaticum TaxID=2751 RepID=UPI00295F15A5|nr:hypothetical protein [Carnobacterium maltaromaticum]